MAIKPLNLQNLQQGRAIVDKDGKPTTELLRILNGNVLNIRTVFTSLVNFLDTIVELNDLITEARDAADAANAAASNATREQALVNSYISPGAVLSATPTQIIIAPHDRVYGDADNTTVAVAGATISHSEPDGSTIYVSYSDPERAGGAVTFIVSTSQPSQTGNTHVVGAAIIPASGTQPGGDGPRRPGYVEPNPL